MTGRDRKILAVVAALALVIGGWLLVIQPKRDQASKLQAQVAASRATLANARAQLLAGQAAKASFPRDYAAVVQLGEAVPPDDNVPSLIYQLQNAASATGIDFRVLKLGSTGSGALGSPSAGGASGSGATPRGQSQSLPPGATTGPGGFPILPFTFTFQGNFFRLADFFARIQRFVVAIDQGVSVSGRLISLDAISLNPAPQGFPQITATVSATTYLMPATQTASSASAGQPATSASAPSASASASQSGPSAPPPAVATP